MGLYEKNESKDQFLTRCDENIFLRKI